MALYYSHYGLPEVAFSVVSAVPTYLGLRVTFSKGCKNDNALNNPDNYQIIVGSPYTSFDFGVISVTTEPDVTYPTYVDLEMTDCTHNAAYQLVVTPNKITSFEDDILTSSNTADFNGVSVMPEVLAAIPLSLSRVKVVFTKYMEQVSELYDPTNYVWSGGVRTLKVEPDTNSSVILTVTTMIGSQIYDLTVG